MTTLCESPHPESSDITCDKPSPCFGFHANATERKSWPGNPLPPPPPAKGDRKSRKGELALMAQRASRRSNPPERN